MVRDSFEEAVAEVVSLGGDDAPGPVLAVVLADDEFNALPLYATSQPTGMWHGKVWRRDFADHVVAYAMVGDAPWGVVIERYAPDEPRPCVAARTWLRLAEGIAPWELQAERWTSGGWRDGRQRLVRR